MVSITSSVASPYVPVSAERRALMTEQERAQLKESDDWRATNARSEAAIADGTAVISGVETLKPAADQSKLDLQSRKNSNNRAASFASTNFENRNAIYGSVDQISAERLADFTSFISDKIKAGDFKSLNFSGSRNGEITHSAEVFVGWLKDRQASLAPGSAISKLG